MSTRATLAKAKAADPIDGIKAQYVAGTIDVDELERRVDAALHGQAAFVGNEFQMVKTPKRWHVGLYDAPSIGLPAEKDSDQHTIAADRDGRPWCRMGSGWAPKDCGCEYCNHGDRQRFPPAWWTRPRFARELERYHSGMTTEHGGSR